MTDLSFNKAMIKLKKENINEINFRDNLLDYKNLYIEWKIKVWKKWNQEYFISAKLDDVFKVFIQKSSMYQYFKITDILNLSVSKFYEWKNEVENNLSKISEVILSSAWFEKEPSILVLSESFDEWDLFQDSNDETEYQSFWDLCNTFSRCYDAFEIEHNFPDSEDMPKIMNSFKLEHKVDLFDEIDVLVKKYKLTNYAIWVDLINWTIEFIKWTDMDEESCYEMQSSKKWFFTVPSELKR